MSQTLQDYINDVRLLLHDPARYADGQFYTDQELIRYINKGRDQICNDTGLYREVRGYLLSQNIEQYTLDLDVLSVLSIFVTWANLRYPVGSKSWQELNMEYRAWNAYRNYPVVFAQVGRQIFFSPTPDQDYYTEWDCPILPGDGKVVTANVLIGGGSGYTIGDQLGTGTSVSGAGLGRGCLFMVTSVDPNGCILALSPLPTSGGAEYAVGDQYNGIGGTGTGAIITVASITSTILYRPADIEMIIPKPYTEPIGYWAAYLAKLKDQSTNEAANYLNMYQTLISYNLGSPINRRA